MNWITPLGLLGLLGIIILIIIYLLKPNYQHKVVSSTYIWKLSMRFRRKKIPFNLFRNLLLIICQILIIIMASFILTQPYIKADLAENGQERIAVIESSASMQAYNRDQGKTRFDYALEKVENLASETINANGLFTVIIAGSDAYMLIERASSMDEVNEQLASLTVNGISQCEYGIANVEDAMVLAEQVTIKNPTCEVLYYTSSQYFYEGDVKVVDCTNEGDWNASIVEVKVENVENHFEFLVDIGVFAREFEGSTSVNKKMSVGITVFDVNYTSQSANGTFEISCEQNVIESVNFKDFEIGQDTGMIYSYSNAYITLVTLDDTIDILPEDNSYYVYGGKKPVLNVLYASPEPNVFFNGIILSLQDTQRDKWDIKIKAISSLEDFELEGYDLYIFEHTMPEIAPEDGIVILMNPDNAPTNLDFTIKKEKTLLPDGEYLSCAPAEPHIVMDYIKPSNIKVSAYNEILSSSGYTPLMYLTGNPAYLLRDQEDSKVVIFPFSFGQSDFSMAGDFAMIIFNLFDYFLPVTIDNYVYDVNEVLDINARSSSVTVSGAGHDEIITEFPAEFEAENPGPYSIRQIPLSGTEVVDNFYVKIATEESNFNLKVNRLPNPLYLAEFDPIDLDLIEILAGIMVALLFAEWFLQLKSQN